MQDEQPKDDAREREARRSGAGRVLGCVHGRPVGQMCPHCGPCAPVPVGDRQERRG